MSTVYLHCASSGRLIAGTAKSVATAVPPIGDRSNPSATKAKVVPPLSRFSDMRPLGLPIDKGIKGSFVTLVATGCTWDVRILQSKQKRGRQMARRAHRSLVAWHGNGGRLQFWWLKGGTWVTGVVAQKLEFPGFSRPLRVVVMFRPFKCTTKVAALCEWLLLRGSGVMR